MKWILSAVLGALMLSACGGGGHDEIEQWIVANTKDLRGNIPKLPPVIPYQPVPYQPDGMEPFSAAKIEPESRQRQSAQGKGGFQPNFEARELRNSLLEKYPLESIKMIGVLNVNHQQLAVLQIDQHVKQVKVGDYVGQDFGIVMQISDREVTLRELVQDSTGDWSERTSALHLQSKEGSGK